jgi:hypothetical protein
MIRKTLDPGFEQLDANAGKACATDGETSAESQELPEGSGASTQLSTS